MLSCSVVILVAYTRLLKSLRPSICPSAYPLVGPSVGNILLFLTKGDLTSVTTPAQCARLMPSCIRPCFLNCIIDFWFVNVNFLLLFYIYQRGMTGYRKLGPFPVQESLFGLNIMNISEYSEYFMNGLVFVMLELRIQVPYKT